MKTIKTWFVALLLALFMPLAVAGGVSSAYDGTARAAVATKADLAGSASQTFSVAPATAAAHAVRADTVKSDVVSITATQASGAITVSGGAGVLDFRSITATSGTASTVITSPANLVIPSGATLGCASGVSARIVVIEINNGGTAEYAVANSAGNNVLSETSLISTTAISGTSTSANVFYSTTARSSLPFRIVGYFDAVNTAGAWGNPTWVQGSGGNADQSILFASLNGNYTTRTAGTRYYNTYSSPIMVYVSFQSNSVASLSCFLGTPFGDVQINRSDLAANTPTSFSFIVPAAWSYFITASAGTSTILYWLEHRM